ncbi:hypothetical protein EGR_10796 [Echinococcus granulosus]|uniref:Uncharacterized protein n=1 Tax=Echinococcus granulosus TaxID=6210 RepID=W6U7J9_ECHGR|nr:hypothetical protein EGR_10796 [Echinococcus granulosus]EUB54342.1 hypothetical protein EGR_10796 [Echinococcus granulosus]
MQLSTSSKYMTSLINAKRSYLSSQKGITSIPIGLNEENRNLALDFFISSKAIATSKHSHERHLRHAF